MPGIPQAYLLSLTTILLYLELRESSFECLGRIRMAQKATLGYNPMFILAPGQNFCNIHSYLVIYQTKVEDRSRRDFLRKKIGRLGGQYDFTILFPTGLSSDTTINEDVKKEHRKYGDILQADFIDTYRNLTFKLDDVFSTGLVGREAGVIFKPLSLNMDTKGYRPFLNGSVIAQYLNQTDDFTSLMYALKSGNYSPVSLALL
ncbi:hypothetical protein NECAME_10968 [Necator americanus]|uniref:Uncharacterized protein n=1 Tax=Necator americanus TaxID=51031 RepID=W2T7E5_NECAM|nr:hypothetical protein NECAME_10968 [Necator americanus]ETN77559.1 hypothetical protein NECAME_10968 [Necator americanus]